MTARPTRAWTARSTATAVTGSSLVLTGTLHATVAALGAAADPPSGERLVRASMEATSTTVAGLDRSFWELFTGFSLVMAVLLTGFGALNLLVLRQAPRLVHETRALLWLDAAVLVPALAVCVLLLPPPPVVLLGVATAAVAVGLSRPDRQRGPDGQRRADGVRCRSRRWRRGW